MATKRKKPAGKPAKTVKAPPEEVAKWVTLEEAAAADDVRHKTGVLVSFATPATWHDVTGARQQADPRFGEVGIYNLRIVAHDCPAMKEAIRDARKAATRKHPSTWNDWTKLPDEGHRELETEIALASLRGGEGIELHGSFELPPDSDGDPSDEAIREHFRALSADFPAWLIKGLYRAGAEILSDPNQVSDREILRLGKKGFACGLAQALASIDTEATVSLARASEARSNLAAMVNVLKDTLSTTPAQPSGREESIKTPSKSTD